MDSKQLYLWRMMAWERAKAELQNVLHTFNQDMPFKNLEDTENEYKEAVKVINEFITKMEDEIIEKSAF